MFQSLKVSMGFQNQCFVFIDNYGSRFSFFLDFQMQYKMYKISSSIIFHLLKWLFQINTEATQVNKTNFDVIIMSNRALT